MLRAPKPRARKQQDRRKRRAYGYRWSKAAKAYLTQNPVCAINGPGCTRMAQCVDHIKPHNKPAVGWYERFWCVDNWQAACHRCHNRKTRRGE